MNPNRKSMIYIVIAGLTVIALVTGGIFLFRSNKEEDKKPSEEPLGDASTPSSNSPTPTSSSGQGMYVLPCTLSTGKGNVGQPSDHDVPLKDILKVTAEPGSVPRWFPQTAADFTKILGTATCGSDIYKGHLPKLLQKYWIEPSDNAQCSGYFALFAAIYPFLKDSNHYVHKMFFDTTEYDDDMANLPKPDGFKSIADLFTTLKKNLNEPDHIKTGVLSYVKHNEKNILTAFRYLLIKHVRNETDFIDGFLLERERLGMPELDPSSNPASDDYIVETVVPYYLDPINISNAQDWFALTRRDLAIWSLILRLNVYAFCLNPSKSELGDLEAQAWINLTNNTNGEPDRVIALTDPMLWHLDCYKTKAYKSYYAPGSASDRASIYMFYGATSPFIALVDEDPLEQ